MSKSCLSPFYNYIMSRGSMERTELEGCVTAEDLYSVNENTSADIDMLKERKRYIWEETQRVSLLEEPERGIEIQKLLAREIDCGLCVQCERCEKEYWKALEQRLCGNDEQKYEFLLPDTIKELLRQKEMPVDAYLDYHKRRKLLKNNSLIILKGFSSSMPMLLNYANNTNMYCGGGLYLRWNNKGIVIDPGYLFVQNLQSYGISVLDIDIVVITHEHIDHSNDMRLLDDLHFNVARKLPKSEFGFNEKNEIEIQVDDNKHIISWYMDKVSCNEAVGLRRNDSGFNERYNHLFCVNPDAEQETELREHFQKDAEVLTGSMFHMTEDVDCHIFRTAHEQYTQDDKTFYQKHTFGCMLECKKKDGDGRNIGYTSDTSLRDGVKNPMLDLLAKCHVIVANISGIYEGDVLLKEEKERHLGYIGCYKILNNALQKSPVNLKYLLLSEFSNQVSDIRFEIAHYAQLEADTVSEHFGVEKIHVLPAEIGMDLNLDDLKVRCSICGKYAEQIGVVKPHGENQKLQYICRECVYFTR